MEITLASIAAIAAKYIEDSIDVKNILIFVKNPIKGGKPAIENKTIVKQKDIKEFILISKDKSVKSLFFFFK